MIQDNGWHIIRCRPRDARLVHPGVGEAAAVLTVADHAKTVPGCVAAVNGGYFEMSTGRPQSMVAQRGAVQVPNYRGGDPYISVTGDTAAIGAGNAPAGVDWALGGGPLLIEGGRNVCPTVVDIERRYPSTRSGESAERTAIGVTAAGELLLVVTKAATIAQVAAKLLALGAVTALNLDGGGSTSLWYRGTAVVGCVRRVANAIAVVAEVEQPPQGLQIVQDLIPVGRHNRPGRLLQLQKLTVHDTANASKGADALAHAKYLKGDTAANLPVSWHYTVDKTGAVQHLPLTEVGYHAGDSTGNNTSIGIEICENSDGDRAAAEANAARLVASLLTQFGLPITAVVPHKYWNNKQCPHILLGRPGGWDGFLAAVQSHLSPPVPVPQPSEVEQLRARIAELEGEAAAREVIIAEQLATIRSIQTLVAKYKAG